jgi:hypothetical protein
MTTPAKEDHTMARADVKDTVKHAGAVLSQSTQEIAATAREQAGPVRDAVSAAVSAAVDTAAERGREAQKVGRKRAKQLREEGQKRAAELQKQAAKSAKSSSKRARKKAGKKAQDWADLAAEKTGRKPKRRKGRLLAILGGGALAAFAVVTARKKQAEAQHSSDGPRTPDTDPT